MIDKRSYKEVSRQRYQPVTGYNLIQGYSPTVMQLKLLLHFEKFMILIEKNDIEDVVDQVSGDSMFLPSDIFDDSPFYFSFDESRNLEVATFGKRPIYRNVALLCGSDTVTLAQVHELGHQRRKKTFFLPFFECFTGRTLGFVEILEAEQQ